MPGDEKPSSVIVVDDHAIFRMGVLQSLALTQDLEVVGEGATSEDALALMAKHSPDVALIDISMPGNGFQAVSEIVRRWPTTRTVLLTASDEDEDVYRALNLGASGYILKGISAGELIAAVKAIAAGETFLSPSLAVRLLDVLRATPPPVAKLNLSAQETKVMRCLAKGMSNSGIADALSISQKTVKFHITNLFGKTGMKSRIQLALLSRDVVEAEAGERQ